MNKRILFTVFGIFILAFVLRVWFLPKLILTFGYDQARDAYAALQIVGGHLKILGPPASTPGLFHGVFYYYLLAPAYFFGHGSPIIAAYWIAFVNSLTVFVVFYLTYLLTKKAGAGVIAAILFAVSFEASQYATWLSNPTIGVLTVALLYLGLWSWVSGHWKRLGPVLAAVGLGLSIQAEVFLLYQIVPLILWLWIARKNVHKKQLVIFGVSLALTVSSMVVSEFKFGFRSLGGVAAIISTQDSIVAAKGLGDFIVLFFNQLGRVFAFNSYPGNIGYGGIFVLILIIVAAISAKHETLSWKLFLPTWLLSHVTVVSLGGTSTPFLLVGIGTAVSILIGIFIYQWFISGKKILAVAVLLVVILGNLGMIFRENARGSTIFSIQKDMVLKKQLAVIDYTYAEAQGKPFSINSLTSPLYINIVWTYLYKWYGQAKYGYLPTWHGHDQVGQVDSLGPVQNPSPTSFLIIEPLDGIPPQYLDMTIGEENVKTKLTSEKYFGTIRVQKRILK